MQVLHVQNGEIDAAGLADLRDELSKFKHEVKRKTAQVSVMEHEQSELMKRITLSQVIICVIIPNINLVSPLIAQSSVDSIKIA